VRVIVSGSIIRGDEVTIGFRPESVSLFAGISADHDGLSGKVAHTSFVGDAVEYQVDLGGQVVRAKGQPFQVFEEGHEVVVQVPPEQCYVLNAG